MDLNLDTTASYGLWVVYDHDRGPFLMSTHRTAPEAAKKAAVQGYGKVGFVPFGADFAEAIKEWETE